MDATRFYTEQDGRCWFFGAIDHHLDEVVGCHTAKLGDRWAALEPIRQGVRHAFGRPTGSRMSGMWAPRGTPRAVAAPGATLTSRPLSRYPPKSTERRSVTT